MSLQGSFSQYSPERLGKHLREWQFVLKNTNFLFSETVDVMVCDSHRQQPFYFRNVKLKPGESVAFNFDTVDWSWCQDDFAAIIDSNNKILKKWQFHIKEYAPGECPECHGTRKCRSCNGKAMIYPPGRIWELKPCDRCASTGICQTCNVHYRKPRQGMGPTGLRPF